MSDRELIERAAMAAGLEIAAARQAERDAEIGREVAGLWLKDIKTWWNPLEDDGDALRLAVKLRLDVKQWNSLAIAANSWDKHAEENTSTQCPYSATRRAIVRVAAKLAPPQEQQ